MTGGRNYTFRIRVGKDGTQYLLIREAQPTRRWSTRHLVRRWPTRPLALTVAEKLNLLKKAIGYVGRRD